MSFWTKAGGFLSNIFGTASAKNEALNNLTQQNAILNAQLQVQQQANNAKSTDITKYLPIALVLLFIPVIMSMFGGKRR